MVAMAPLFALLVVLGGTGTILIYHLGNQIDTILRENYRSVVYMRDLNEALERIDSSFQFALAGREKESKDEYRARWELFKVSLRDEQQNITLPGEGELVERLTELSDRYRRQGDKFFENAGQTRKGLFFGTRVSRGYTPSSARSRSSRARSCGSTRRTCWVQSSRPRTSPVPR